MLSGGSGGTTGSENSFALSFPESEEELSEVEVLFLLVAVNDELLLFSFSFFPMAVFLFATKFCALAASLVSYRVTEQERHENDKKIKIRETTPPPPPPPPPPTTTTTRDSGKGNYRVGKVKERV